MTKLNDGIPEIVAKVADNSDNETVKEKWEELKTLVHLVHKDEVLRQRKKLDDWKTSMSDVNRQLSKLQQSSWGVGLENDDFGVDYSFTGSGISLGDYTTSTSWDSYNDDTDDKKEQIELSFPMSEDEEYANAGISKEQAEKHIEENILSTPLSEYEAIEELSKEKIKQQKDPKHNQW
jgi:hypothetical protein